MSTNIPYFEETTDHMLGTDFLTWLWFRSEQGFPFFGSEGSPIGVSMEQRIEVRGGEGENLETATVSGAHSSLREAKLGLLMGKKVVQTLVRIEKDGMAWQAIIKAEDFSIGSLRSPKVDRDADDDLDAYVLEKVYLMELYLGTLDTLFRQFLQTRLDSVRWAEEKMAVGKWITTSAADTVNTATPTVSRFPDNHQDLLP